MNEQATSASGQVIPFRVGGVFVAPVFLVVALVFLSGFDASEVPKAATPEFNRAELTIGPARESLVTDPPTIHLNEYRRTCMECHVTFKNPDPRVTSLEQHKHIKLRHGINTHCYDCHHLDDRNALRLKDGSKVPFTRSVELCAQCHNPIYRDWQRGLHGKRLGHWNDQAGPRQPLPCAGCHDPHWPSRPAMSGLRPLPGPHTLRMGEHEAHHGESKDPLQRALNHTSADHPRPGHSKGGTGPGHEAEDHKDAGQKGQGHKDAGRKDAGQKDQGHKENGHK